MPTRRDYWCPIDGEIQEVQCPLSRDIEAPSCPQCGRLMERYFGGTRALTINFGYRENRYPTTEDARIAQYQFENL